MDSRCVFFECGCEVCDSKCTSGIVLWNFTYESGTRYLCFCSGTCFGICCRKVQNGFPADPVTSVLQFCRNIPCCVAVRKVGLADAERAYGYRRTHAGRCIFPGSKEIKVSGGTKAESQADESLDVNL